MLTNGSRRIHLNGIGSMPFIQLGVWPMVRADGRQVYVSTFERNPWSPAQTEWFDSIIPAIAEVYETIERWERAKKGI